MSIADIELMTPGSTWTNGKGRAVSVLFLSNASLPAKVQKKHPPQVVYANEAAEICNRSIEDFLNIYSFHNVDPVLESRITELFAFNEDSVENLAAAAAATLGSDDADEAGDFEIVDNESGSSTTAASTKEEITEVTTEADLPLVAYTMFSPAELAVSPEVLSHLTVSYTQEPHVAEKKEESALLHKLKIRVTPEVTQDMIVETIPKLHPIVTALDLKIDWDFSLGAFVVVESSGTYVNMVLGTYVNVDTKSAAQSADVQAEAIAAPAEAQVQQAAATQAQAQPQVQTQLSVG